MIFKKQSLIIIILLATCKIVKSQNNLVYNINVNIDSIEKKLNVEQSISFTNRAIKLIDTIYLADWSNSYSSINTPLAQRFGEEYDRSFFLSKKSKLGNTKINFMKEEDKELKWSRVKNKPDIIIVIPEKPINIKEEYKFKLNYEIKVPDSKFNHYGYDQNGNIFLRNWHISLNPIFNGKWLNHSNLNLDDLSSVPARYNLRINDEPQVKIDLNLKFDKLENQKQLFSGIDVKELILSLSTESQFESFMTVNENKIVTDIFNKVNKDEAKMIINRIDRFVGENFTNEENKKYLVPKLMYEKNPFYGLNDLPDFLAPFDKNFLAEISYLKAFLHFYLNSNTNFDLRKNHWIIGGLQTYIIIKYIEKYYPNQKFIGRIGEFKLMKGYNIAKINFNESFFMFYELMEKTNLQQSDLLPKDKLIKFNERFGSPYHVGVGLRFLEEYIGDSFRVGIKKYFEKGANNDLVEVLKEYSNKNIDWFKEFYLAKRTSIDISVKSVRKRGDSLHVKINKFSKNKLPFILAQVKNNRIISKKWISNIEKEGVVFLKNLEPDYIAINPKTRYTEKNKINNWKYVGNLLNIKPIHFNFLKDYQSPKRVQMFYNPIFNYNLYDGVSYGSKFYDKGILAQKFTFEIMPQYSSVNKNLVGKMNFSLLIHNEEKKNYASVFNFFASSYHYDEGLRYQVFRPALTFYFRTDNFRLNSRHLLGLYYFYVDRVESKSSNTNPNYKIVNLRYLYSNPGAIKHMTFDSNFQFSNKFAKMEFEFDIRRLLPNGSQISARFFIGKFLKHNNRQTNFFDFNLNRPQDYLFKYNYFGRSEDKGIYSQQIVMAEGGFKSIHPKSTANDYLLSANITLGIWKWIESYVDIGSLKNTGENISTFFGSGIRFNIIPDYLEIYFPILSSNGWEIDRNEYSKKIRFVLTMNTKQFLGLFSRRWF